VLSCIEIIVYTFTKLMIMHAAANMSCLQEQRGITRGQNRNERRRSRYTPFHERVA